MSGKPSGSYQDYTCKIITLSESFKRISDLSSLYFKIKANSKQDQLNSNLVSAIYRIKQTGNLFYLKFSIKKCINFKKISS